MWIEQTTIDFFKKRILRENVVNGDLDGRFQANLRNKTRDSSVCVSCSSMEASYQNLIQELKVVG